MATATRQTQSGRITIVQESRFHLAAEDGRGYLFILARGANVGADDLCRLQASGARVTVTYSGTPGLASCVAHVVHAR
ncbi:MAG: hypothetical protein ACTHMJ_02690 [Thermomicrobiales bacterium]